MNAARLGAVAAMRMPEKWVSARLARRVGPMRMRVHPPPGRSSSAQLALGRCARWRATAHAVVNNERLRGCTRLLPAQL
jgi:hypothetical protein